MAAAGSRWKPEEYGTLIELVKQGYTRSQMSQYLSRSEEAIRLKAYELGLMQCHSDNGEFVMVHTKDSAGSNTRARQKWLQPELDSIVTQINEGIDYITLSGLTGRSVNAISLKAEELGVVGMYAPLDGYKAPSPHKKQQVFLVQPTPPLPIPAPISAPAPALASMRVNDIGIERQQLDLDRQTLNFERQQLSLAQQQLELDKQKLDFERQKLELRLSQLQLSSTSILTN